MRGSVSKTLVPAATWSSASSTSARVDTTGGSNRSRTTASIGSGSVRSIAAGAGSGGSKSAALDRLGLGEVEGGGRGFGPGGGLGLGRGLGEVEGGGRGFGLGEVEGGFGGGRGSDVNEVDLGGFRLGLDVGALGFGEVDLDRGSRPPPGERGADEVGDHRVLERHRRRFEGGDEGLGAARQRLATTVTAHEQVGRQVAEPDQDHQVAERQDLAGGRQRDRVAQPAGEGVAVLELTGALQLERLALVDQVGLDERVAPHRHRPVGDQRTRFIEMPIDTTTMPTRWRLTAANASRAASDATDTANVWGSASASWTRGSPSPTSRR